MKHRDIESYFFKLER